MSYEKISSAADAVNKLINSSKKLTHIKRNMEVGGRIGAKKGLQISSDWVKRNPSGSKLKDGLTDIVGGIGSCSVGAVAGGIRGAATGIKNVIKGKVN
jgi:hypothetical protein